MQPIKKARHFFSVHLKTCFVFSSTTVMPTSAHMMLFDRLPPLVHVTEDNHGAYRYALASRYVCAHMPLLSTPFRSRHLRAESHLQEPLVIPGKSHVHGRIDTRPRLTCKVLLSLADEPLPNSSCNLLRASTVAQYNSGAVHATGIDWMRLTIPLSLPSCLCVVSLSSFTFTRSISRTRPRGVTTSYCHIHSLSLHALVA